MASSWWQASIHASHRSYTGAGPGEGFAEDSKPPFPQEDSGNDLVLPHLSCDGDLAVGLTMNVWLG